MGTPVVPGEKGDDCPAMTPDPWPADKTPKYLLATFHHIIACPFDPGKPDPPNGDFVLTQDPLNPCLWTRADAYFSFQYDIRLGASTLQIWDGHMLLAFHSVVTDVGWAYFHSDRLCPIGTRYAEGDAFVDLFDFPGTAHQLMYEYGLNPSERSKFDVLPVPDEPPYVQVRRFGNIRTPMNIKIKTDATHKDQFEMFEA